MKTVKSISSIDSSLLADYVLSTHGPMSHLKLQKLLYLIEGYHLAYFTESLIDDKFQAWTHGPVSRKVYDSLKDKSRLYADVGYEPASDSDPDPAILVQSLLTQDQIDLVNEVLDLYDKESGFELEALTHAQTPWINARNGLPLGAKCENVISKEDMKQYFSQFLN